MSEQMMRDPLITAREVLVLEGYAEDNLAVVKIDEALAQQPAAVVELTDDELMDIARPTCGNFRWPSTALDIMRQAIAAHIAKQSGSVA